jgi:CheY-like chemotaxis protein
MLRLRVLLAEDHAESARTVTLLLRRWGHDVRVVHNGRLALEAALAEPFDAILLDIDLPGLDGFEIANELRRRPQFDTLPLIATTGHAEEEYRLRAMAAGFDQYLLKPLSCRSLLCPAHTSSVAKFLRISLPRPRKFSTTKEPRAKGSIC